MTTSKKDEAAMLRDAAIYEELRDQLGQKQLENFRYVKSQLADWYIAITAVCFAIGGISISTGVSQSADKSIGHPALFWWGSLLLIANGILIFLVRKIDLEGEDAGFANLKQMEADLWRAEKIAREVADGDNSRADAFEQLRERIADDYSTRVSPIDFISWTRFIVASSFIDVAFGLLLFPVLMLSSQLLGFVDLSFNDYLRGIWILLCIYLIYVAIGLVRSIRNKKTVHKAELQIQAEILNK